MILEKISPTFQTSEKKQEMVDLSAQLALFQTSRFFLDLKGVATIYGVYEKDKIPHVVFPLS